MDLVKIKISQDEKDKILKSTNHQNHIKKNLDYYYDQDTINLVQEKEKFLIDKYNYNFKDLI